MSVKILTGDCRELLKTLPDESVNCCITSPPYFGLRDYGVEGQIGLEPTPEAYVNELVAVFNEVRRVLRDDGTLWLNLGDTYAGGGRGGNPADSPFRKQATNAGSIIGAAKNPAPVPSGMKPKDLMGIPWMVAFALRANGWYLRQDIIWSKPNPMPESVTDRCTKAHEYIFMLSKSSRYYYDQDAIKEPAIYFDDDRKGRAMSGHKSNPTDKINGIRPIYKDARSYDGKNADKQRGHGRRHAGFNDRWDQMEKSDQCSAMRNKRSVWEVATKPYAEAHFATFPPQLIEPCVKAGCPKDGTILDPFGGAGTTGMVSDRLGRSAIMIELNPAYITIADNRLKEDAGMFAEVSA